MQTCPKCQTKCDEDDKTCGLCRHNFASVQSVQNHEVARKVLKFRKSGFPYFAYPDKSS